MSTPPQQASVTSASVPPVSAAAVSQQQQPHVATPPTVNSNAPSNQNQSQTVPPPNQNYGPAGPPNNQDYYNRQDQVCNVFFSFSNLSKKNSPLIFFVNCENYHT